MTDSQSDPTSQLLREATHDLAPDVDRLVAGGVTRGHTLRRRRRITTTLVAAAVVGVIGTAASVAPGLLDRGDDAGRGLPVDSDSPPSAEPSRPRGAIDALITVSAEDFPAVVAERLPELDVGGLRKESGFPLVDERQEKVAFFDVEGTLASVQIGRADSVATCEQQAAQSDELRCEVVDGVELWTYGPATAEGVTYQSVTATVHGFNVTADSYNAAEGKDVPIVTDVPPISIAQLTALATDGVWFAEPDDDPVPELIAARDLPDVVTSVVPGEVVEAKRLGGYINDGDNRIAHFTLDGLAVSAFLAPFDGDTGAAERACRTAGLECATRSDGTVIGRRGETAPAVDGGYSSRVVAAWLPGYTATVQSYNAGDLASGEVLAPEPIAYGVLEDMVLADGWLSGS